MAGTTINRPYKFLAEHYDRIFTFHLPWFQAARQRILGDILPGVTSACDLGCGTGTTALLLVSQGIKMFAVDLSPVMCRIVRAKVSVACDHRYASCRRTCGLFG